MFQRIKNLQLPAKVFLANAILILLGVAHTWLGIAFAIAGSDRWSFYGVFYGIPLAALLLIVASALLDYLGNFSYRRALLIVALTLGPSILLSLNYWTYGPFSMWGVALREKIVADSEFKKSQKNIDSFVSRTVIEGKEVCLLPDGIIEWKGAIERPESNRSHGDIIFQAQLFAKRKETGYSEFLAYGVASPLIKTSLGWPEVNIYGSAGSEGEVVARLYGNTPENLYKEKELYFDLSQFFEYQSGYSGSKELFEEMLKDNIERGTIIFRYHSSNDRTFKELIRPVKEFVVPARFINSAIRYYLYPKNNILSEDCVLITAESENRETTKSFYETGETAKQGDLAIKWQTYETDNTGQVFSYPDDWFVAQRDGGLASGILISNIDTKNLENVGVEALKKAKNICGVEYFFVQGSIKDVFYYQNHEDRLWCENALKIIDEKNAITKPL